MRGRWLTDGRDGWPLTPPEVLKGRWSFRPHHKNITLGRCVCVCVESAHSSSLPTTFIVLSSVLFVHRCTLLWVFTLTLARRAATQSQRRRITWLIDIHFFTFSPSPLSVYAALSLNHYLNGLLLCLIVCVRHCIMNCIMIIIIKNERAAFERDGTTLLVFSPFASSQWLLSPWLASHSNLESVNYHTLFSHSLCIFTSSSSSSSSKT